MKALDLFCGAGGATRGLQLAGFEVHGVDLHPQKHYCGDHFTQADALEFPLDGFDFIWASPPCQHYSQASIRAKTQGHSYPDLVAATRLRLSTLALVPWVMENVPKSPLRADLILCGSQFGLKVIRHRLFEFDEAIRVATFPLLGPCNHAADAVTVTGHGTPTWAMEQRKRRGFHAAPTIKEKRDAMGIHWTNRDELNEMIPPAYSEFIGKQIMEIIK